MVPSTRILVSSESLACFFRLVRGGTLDRTMRALAVLLVISLGAAFPSWAADSATEEAKLHVRNATAAYNLGSYTEAAREYEAAYKQTLDANLLFNIGQSYRLAGDREKAIIAYRSFIRSAPRSEQRSLAESKLHDLEQQAPSAPVSPKPAPAAPPAPLPAGSAPPAPVAPAAQPVPSAAAPPANRLPAAPSPPALAPQPAGMVLAQPQPAQPESPQKESHFYARWPFWTAVGVAVAGGVALGVVLSQSGSTTPNLGNPSLGTKEY